MLVSLPGFPSSAFPDVSQKHSVHIKPKLMRIGLPLTAPRCLQAVAGLGCQTRGEEAPEGSWGPHVASRQFSSHGPAAGGTIFCAASPSLRHLLQMAVPK